MRCFDSKYFHSSNCPPTHSASNLHPWLEEERREWHLNAYQAPKSLHHFAVTKKGAIWMGTPTVLKWKV